MRFCVLVVVAVLVAVNLLALAISGFVGLDEYFVNNAENHTCAYIGDYGYEIHSTQRCSRAVVYTCISDTNGTCLTPRRVIQVHHPLRLYTEHECLSSEDIQNWIANLHLHEASAPPFTCYIMPFNGASTTKPGYNRIWLTQLMSFIKVLFYCLLALSGLVVYLNVRALFN